MQIGLFRLMETSSISALALVFLLTVVVGIVLSYVAKFHFKSGILSGFNLKVVFLPKVE